MSEKPKRKPKDFGKASLDFVAPYSLADCVLRIRDTKLLGTDFMTSYEKVEPEVYHFKTRRTWYDRRGYLRASDVMLEGYLKGIDETSTTVIAKTHVPMTTPVIIIILVGFGMITGIASPHPPDGFIFFIGAAMILLYFWRMIWFDGRSLISLIYRAMSDDLL